jgi:hypothetical protein
MTHLQAGALVVEVGILAAPVAIGAVVAVVRFVLRR